jgi:16S rRNA (cytosine1402-N4)-methyltransferase
MNYHKSVLLEEALKGLNISSGHRYIDATLGGGGHTAEIINRGGIVLGIDADSDSIEYVSRNLESKIENQELKLAIGNFSEIDRLAKENGFDRVSGILFDLGVSSHQIDKPARGFSYLKSGPLDMRMDQRLGVKAADLVNGLGRSELFELFKNYGEEPLARKIADYIVSVRGEEPITTTQELADVLARAYGFNNITDFAKAKSSQRVFQALRIAVNDELDSLRLALPKSLELLDIGGRLVVITFHSLEDRIVKQMFLQFESEGKGKVLTHKPILPGKAEVEANKRSKGAKLRILEKIDSASSI